MDGTSVPVKAKCPFSSSDILESVCNSLELPKELTFYFALYIVRSTTGDIDRKLMNFESPHLTLKNMGPDHRCVLRTGYWDSSYDQELMGDPVGLNLLFMQAINENVKSETIADAEARDKLTRLQATANKKLYLDFARSLPNYGVLRFSGCIVDYPEPNTAATVLIGNKEICFQTPADEPDIINETKFKVTRIRCWKITTSHNVSL